MHSTVIWRAKKWPGLEHLVVHEDADGVAAFRYEAGSFRADLRVDSRGLVQDYPGFWEVLS